MLFCKKLKNRTMYALHSGKYIGGFLVPIKEHDRGASKAVLILPEMVAMYISDKEIQYDLKNRNMKRVSKLPPDVYDVCKANFNYYLEKAGIYAS